MRIAFFLGWVLMLCAFAVAGAETIARTLPGGTGWVLSTSELWRALWPSAYLLAEVRISNAIPWLWDPVIVWFLSPPAWVLFGLPGVILAWTCRPNRILSAAQEEELREHEASLFLYDELASEARKWARDEGSNPDEDDRLPSHELIDLFEKDIDDDGFDANADPVPEFVKPSER